MAGVVLIEDQVMFRSSMSVFLSSKAGLTVVGTFGSGFAFFEAVPSLPTFELALLDIQLPGESGIELTVKINEQFPHVKVILLSSVREDFILHQALRSGADAIVHKDDTPETLLHAITTVVSGGCFYGHTIQQLRRAMAQNPDFFAKILSEKEQAVLELLGQGLSNEDAAPLLALSPETVQTHRRNIMRKLGVHSTAQLQSYALKRGFTTVTDLR